MDNVRDRWRRPAGVELAGAIVELTRHGLEREFRAIDPANATVVLVQSAPRLLPAFPPTLSIDAATALRKLGVTVRLDAKVEQISAEGVMLAGELVTRGQCCGRPACRLPPRARGWMPNGTGQAGSLSERISRLKNTTGSSRLATSPPALRGADSPFPASRPRRNKAATTSLKCPPKTRGTSGAAAVRIPPRRKPRHDRTPGCGC